MVGEGDCGKKDLPDRGEEAHPRSRSQQISFRLSKAAVGGWAFAASAPAPAHHMLRTTPVAGRVRPPLALPLLKAMYTAHVLHAVWVWYTSTYVHSSTL